MKKSPLFAGSNLLALCFVVLYGVGAWVNFKEGNMIIAWLWIVLFVLNLGGIVYRLLKKE